MENQSRCSLPSNENDGEERVSVLVSVAGDAVGEVPRGGVLEAEDVGEEEDAGAVVVLDGLEEVRADAVVALADDQVRAPHQLARPVIVDRAARRYLSLAAPYSSPLQLPAPGMDSAA
jgi:hypothetical protein